MTDGRRRKLVQVIDHHLREPLGADLLREALAAGVHLSLACALVEQESGGRNIFGHDPVRFGQYGYRKDRTVKVTRRRYRRYLRLRKLGFGMQGVGPCQLTWWELQDEADRLGGCWRPEINMRVAFRRLKQLTDAHGEREGVAAYNGSGTAAVAYSSQVRARASNWHLTLQ
jgi:hypothetical protein